VDATCPDRHKHAAGAAAPPQPTTPTIHGSWPSLPFQKAGRSGKSPVPAFAVKIIDKSPGMASHESNSRRRCIGPSSWRGWRTDRQKEGGGAGKPTEFQISRRGLASTPPFLQNLQFCVPLRRWRWRCSVRRGGKKGRHPDGWGLFHNPRRPTCLGSRLFWVVSSTSCRDLLLNPANRGPKPSSPRKAPVREVAARNHRS
jgi:hypothetical protein